jgi:hypothetical protein
MPWIIRFDDEFEHEFLALRQDVQDNLLAAAKLLADYGPQLGRPYADTLKASKHANMKELRFDAADGVWRVAFAFDPRRQGILLVAGDKSGVSKSRFYRQLIAKADKRYTAHLARLKKTFTKRG